MRAYAIVCQYSRHVRMRAYKNFTRLLAAALVTLISPPSAAQADASSQAQPYRYAAAPAWVNVLDDVKLEGDKPVEEGHSDYLLIDNQMRLAEITSHYFRAVERLTNQEAVDRAAQLSIQIDPEHEMALLHDVHVIRKGRAIDKLADARRSLLHREEDLENKMLNGRVTLHLLLQDVRVGDVLDFSYTLEHRDPFGERGYNDWFMTQWSQPVRRQQLRLLSPADRPLMIKDYGKLGAPVRSQTGQWVETLWRARGIAALENEDGRPNWHIYYPRIEISEFRDWDAVRSWAKPLYRVERRDDPAVRELIAEVRAVSDDRSRVLRALRFVQDDIRYTGLEIGAGAYRPSQPGVVLARRYGDCKDKTLLLVTVLRELGIEAWPALVHSSLGRGVIERAPGPGAFDHVIALVRLGGKDYWLDATASGQGGDLDTLVQADFGPALVIDDTHQGLRSIPPRQGLEATHQVTETYDLRGGRDKAARFTVQTVFREEDADRMRARLRTNTATSVSKDYLDYYRKTYPGARMTRPVVVKDDRAANVLTLTENYEIDHPFEKDEGQWKFHLAAYLVSDQAKKPELTERLTPLGRRFPMHVHHEIVAYLPQPWNIDPEVVRISDPAFEYSSDLRYRDGTLHIVYDLRSVSDHVPAGRVTEYSRQIHRVHEDAFYTLFEPDADARPAAVSVDAPAAPGAVTPPLTGPSFAAIVALLGGLFAGVVAARAIARSRVRGHAVDEDAPVGVDGWLLIPGTLTCLLPVIGGLLLCMLLNDYGSAAAHAGLDHLGQYIVSAQIALFCVLIMLGGMGTWLVWKRIDTWPRLFHAQVVVIAALVALDLLITWRSGLDSVNGIDPLVVPCFIAVVCVLLSVYVAKSQRVHATFVNAWTPTARGAGARLVRATGA